MEQKRHEIYVTRVSQIIWFLWVKYVSPIKFTNSRDIISAQHVRKQCNEFINSFTDIRDDD